MRRLQTRMGGGWASENNSLQLCLDINNSRSISTADLHNAE